MAPRRQPRKSPKGQMRRDAALDAMRGYGFPEELIDTTIKELLDVYGLEGWPFIEEASYKVLLDNILEKVEKEAMEKGDSLQSDGREGNNAKALAAGPSSSAIGATCSNEEAMAIQLQSDDVALDTASKTNKVPVTALLTDGSESNARLPGAEVEGSSWKDINLNQDSRKKQINNVGETNDRNFQAAEKLGSSSHSPQYDILSPERVDALPSQRRRPYHGWISSDEDEELVELTPAPLPEKLAKLLFVTDGSRNRKRGWDVRPEDM